MLLSDLFANVTHKQLGIDVDISRIEYDSRKVSKDTLFVCVVGTFEDGHIFAKQAEESGAVALLVQRELPDIQLPQIMVENTRIAMAQAAAHLYGYPARKMKMVGITGTNGKTTTTHMIKSIAEQAGQKVGLIGTITNLIGDEILPTEHTTPESSDLHRILALMADEQVDVCVMEVSSHSLDQNRVYGIEFDVAVFTNLTQDHLDYHKNMENYKKAKTKLFKQCKSAVFNVDDTMGALLYSEANYPALRNGIREDAEIWAKGIDITPRGVQFDMKLPEEDLLHIRLHISGLFSVYNALSAASASVYLGCKPIDIKKGLELLSSVSGRLESLHVGERDFTILLDYAHTPDALENVLQTVRSFADAKIITLFGCGGGRDQAKRPIMGEIAGRFSDYCIITSDNPRKENPMKIIKMIEEGMKKTACDYIIMENRQKAIQHALSMAEKGDVVLLAGKGHETYQEINGVKSHFDEKEIVANLMAKMDMCNH